MRDFRDAKAMARALREALTRDGVETTHSKSIELIAKAFGYDNWNTLSAKIEATHPHAISTETSTADGREPALATTLYCSLQKLIAGPSVYICDECVELCVDIIRDGILWKVMSRLRAREENGSDAYQAALEHVRSTSAEEVASYVEQSKVGVLHNQQTLHLIDQRLAHGKVPQEHDALASPTFAHLNTMSNEELVTLQKRTQRELTHYENALRIGTTVLEERRREAGS